MAEAEEAVVIVGAAIAGLATAAALTRVGVRSAIVLEKSRELHTTGAVISIFPNGWCAIRALGVAHKLADTYPSYKMYLEIIYGWSFWILLYFLSLRFFFFD